MTANAGADAAALPPDIYRSVRLFKKMVFVREQIERLPAHLEDTYGVRVAELTRLDVGVFRVDRHDGPSWMARVFSPARPLDAVEGDAAVLRLLAERGFPAERLAHGEPVSVLAGQGVLVTELLPGGRPQRTPAVFQRLGDLLGRLHTLDAISVTRPAGGWHHLSLRGGDRGDDVAALQMLLARAETALPEQPRPRLEALRAALAAIDAGRDLPSALHHPDFTPPNVIAVPGAGPALIDWTGAGMGPRIFGLAMLLRATGGNPRLIAAVVAGYAPRVTLDAEELARLDGAIGASGLIIDTWSVLLGRAQLRDVVDALPAQRDRATAIAELAREALAAQ